MRAPSPAAIRGAAVRARLAIDAAKDGDLDPLDSALATGYFLGVLVAEEPELRSLLRGRRARYASAADLDALAFAHEPGEPRS